MSEIKRYRSFYCYERERFLPPYEYHDGEWVRWDDVKDLIAIVDDVLDVLKKHCERIENEPQLKIGSKDWLEYWGPRFSPHSSVSEEAQKK